MNTKRIGAAGAALLVASTMAACANNAAGAPTSRRSRPTRARPP